MVEYIEWNAESIEEYMSNKFRKRGLDVEEYVYLTEFLRDIKPTVVIDVGTFLGVSGYILGTASPKLKHLYALEHHTGPSYMGPYKGLVKTEDYGKYLPDYAIFKTYDYVRDLPPILEAHEGENVFVFYDAGKNPMRILHQIKLSSDYKVPYIAIHDTNVNQVKRAIRRGIDVTRYKIHSKYTGDGEYKGITILEEQ